MYNYSIIIPHRNTPDLLQRCIDSIPLREDLQIIIIDDNSDVSKVNFDVFPGCDRTNVEVYFCKYSGGAGAARNIGLSMAKGAWIIFADADDVFDTNTFNECMDKYVKNDDDIIYFNAELVDVETNVTDSNFEYTKHIKRGKSSDEKWVRYMFTNPWARFVKHSFINTHNICCDETIAGNDAMFSLKCGYYAKKIIIDTSTIYYWLLRRKGNITSNISETAIMDRFDVAVRMNKFKYDHNINSKYRTNLYAMFLKVLHVVGMSYFDAFVFITKKTNPRYVIMDLVSFVCSYMQRHIKMKFRYV